MSIQEGDVREEVSETTLCIDNDMYVCSFKEKQCVGWFKSKHSYIEVLVRKHLTLAWAVQAAPCATQHWAAACSGHGFKHSAAIGEAVAQWMTGRAPEIDLQPFRYTCGR